MRTGFLGAARPSPYLACLFPLLHIVQGHASHRIDSFPIEYTSRIDSSYFHRGPIPDSGKPIQPRSLAFGQVLYRYKYSQDYALYFGEVKPETWHDMDFFRVPVSLSERVHLKLYKTSNTLTDVTGAYFTENYVCMQNASRLYFYRGDRKDSVEREPIKPTLAKLAIPHAGGKISFLDGRTCPSPCFWISDGSPFFTAKLEAPEHYRRSEFQALAPGRYHPLEFPLVPIFTQGVLDSLILAWRLDGTPRELGEAEARRREREVRLFRDSLGSKRAEKALDLDRSHAKPLRVPGEGWFAFRKRKKDWRIVQEAALRSYDLLIVACDRTLEELEDWSVARDCAQDTLHLDPREVALEALSGNGREARVRFRMDRRPFWFEFLGLLPVDAVEHATLQAAWTSGQLEVRALFWGGAQVAIGDSTYQAGMTRLQIQLTGRVRDIRHGFILAPELRAAKNHDRTARQFEKWGQRCGERVCRGFWPCHWGKVTAGGALAAAAAAGGYCYRTDCLEPDPELKTYQVDIEFE